MDNLIALKQVTNSILSEIENLRMIIATAEEKEQDILHFIEFGKMNARDGYKLAQALKTIRSERREAKNRWAQLQSALSFSIPANSNPNMVCDAISKSVDKGIAVQEKTKQYIVRRMSMETIVGRKLNKDDNRKCLVNHEFMLAL